MLHFTLKIFVFFFSKMQNDSLKKAKKGARSQSMSPTKMYKYAIGTTQPKKKGEFPRPKQEQSQFKPNQPWHGEG